MDIIVLNEGALGSTLSVDMVLQLSSFSSLFAMFEKMAKDQEATINLRRIDDRLLWTEFLKLVLEFIRPFGSQLRHFFILKDVVFLAFLFQSQ
jgi:hypothetical protein